MKRLLEILLISALLSAGSFSLYAKEKEKKAPPVPLKEMITLEDLMTPDKEVVYDIYYVKKGDCLWKIAQNVYKDKGMWPIIWEKNRFIEDSHWIFPGDPLIIPIVQEKVEPEKRAEGTFLSVYVPGKKGNWPFDFEFEGYITDYPSKKAMVAQGDMVFIDVGTDKGVKPDTRFNVYKSGKSVKHPRTRQKMGIMIEKVGVLRVTEDVTAKTSSAVIMESNGPINKGFMIKRRASDVR